MVAHLLLQRGDGTEGTHSVPGRLSGIARLEAKWDYGKEKALN